MIQQAIANDYLRNDTTTQVRYAPLLRINAQKIVDLTEVLPIGVAPSSASACGTSKSTCSAIDPFARVGAADVHA